MSKIQKIDDLASNYIFAKSYRKSWTFPKKLEKTVQVLV